MAIVSIEGSFIKVNSSFCKIIQYTSTELEKMKFQDITHPDDLEVNLNNLRMMLNGESECCEMEKRYIKKDGSNVWVLLNISIVKDAMKKPLYYISQIQDITEKKVLQEELKKSEERFRLLAEYSSDMITMHDRKGTYLYASPACKEILQYAEDELVGKDAYLFIHPEDMEKVNEGHRTALNNAYSVFSYRIRRKDGEYVWIESAVKFMDDIRLGEEKLIVVSRNISGRKLVEQRLQEANELLQHLSTIDGLTGVSNRRTFDKRLEMEWNRGLRSSAPLSLLMLDIDFFKAYNDTYGHQGGDGCLKQIASIIQETLGRSTDLLCRYGGEEFCVILPETDKFGAKIVGEKIRTAIEVLKIPHSGSKILPWITISIGAATMIPNVYTSFMNLVSNADKAVYKAKFDGRNCVRSYE
jgi:diguanylate cyclase (GGDEF)-like protein/PAS domain S-box-containing protein